MQTIFVQPAGSFVNMLQMEHFLSKKRNEALELRKEVPISSNYMLEVTKTTQGTI